MKTDDFDVVSAILSLTPQASLPRALPDDRERCLMARGDRSAALGRCAAANATRPARHPARALAHMAREARGIGLEMLILKVVVEMHPVGGALDGLGRKPLSEDDVVDRKLNMEVVEPRLGTHRLTCDAMTVDEIAARDKRAIEIESWDGEMKTSVCGMPSSNHLLSAPRTSLRYADKIRPWRGLPRSWSFSTHCLASVSSSMDGLAGFTYCSGRWLRR